MKTTVRYATYTALLILLGFAAGCAAQRLKVSSAPAEAAPAPAQTTAADDMKSSSEAELSEPSTLAEAELLFERARVDFDRLAWNAPVLAPPAPAPASVPRPAPEPAGESRRADAAAPSKSAAAPPPPGSGNSCETACKAYASLSRASEAVCRLDSSDGKRCERARQIRDDASRRVATCGCH